MSLQPIGKEIVLPDGSVAPLSPAFKANDTLYISGQLPFQADGSLNTGDISEQTEIVMAHIDKLLTDAGLTKKNLVKLTIWLVDAADFAGFNKAYSEYLGDHRPARSTVRCDLVLPGAKVEIEAIAAY